MGSLAPQVIRVNLAVLVHLAQQAHVVSQV
uniref:Uncharacterized protein n=1 Tax=Gallus gallus TaxID=9031 RepID=V9GZU9_CHICK|nr:non-collagenous alternate transcript 1 of collagen alpha 1 (III) gene - chicken [Gallus gallus]AAA83408.1 unknown [Gallus gallus]